RERQQPGDERFATPVFIGAIRMKAVAATAGLDVRQRNRQIVSAEKPVECPQRIGSPPDVGIDAPRGTAGRNRRRCLQRLLIECPGWRQLLAETMRSHGTKT